MTEDEAVTVLSEFAQYLDEYIVRPAVTELKAEKRESRWHLFGEYLRDAAVLIIVFVPLDYFVTRAVEERALIPTRFWVAIAVCSFCLLLLGMWCSTRGKE
jgi:hypothetical protein